MRSRILPLTSLVVLVLVGASIGCGTVSAGLMDAYWIDALYDGTAGDGVDQAALDTLRDELLTETDNLGESIDDLQSELGNPGVAGADGADGEDGKDGADGADGADGVDGVDGADGADGEDGEGVLARAQIDANGVEVNDSDEITSSRESEGTYRIIVAVPEDIDTGDPALN